MTSSSSKSAGNDGSRGSRGLPNSGAQDGAATNQDTPPAARDEAPDLRGDDARGGGGAGSNSSRSADTGDTKQQH